MKRYIRTKETEYGCLIDTEKYKKQTGEECYIPKDEIIAQSDEIIDLLQIGDIVSDLMLIDMGERIIETKYSINTIEELKDIKENFKNGNIAIVGIYAPNGNDYKLVAKHKKGKEWEVV